MDWGKAKSILIFALIGTNIFLGLLIINSKWESNVSDYVSDEDIAVVKTMLEKLDIFLDAEIPREIPMLKLLDIESVTLDEDLISEQILKQQTGQMLTSDDDAIAACAQSFLQLCDIDLSESYIKSVNYIEENDSWYVSLGNKHDNIIIENSNLNCTIKDGHVTLVDGEWFLPVDSAKNKGLTRTRMEGISAPLALIQFVQEEGLAGTRITDITLVFNWNDADSFSFESPISATASPAWKISYEQDGEVQPPAYIETISSY